MAASVPHPAEDAAVPIEKSTPLPYRSLLLLFPPHDPLPVAPELPPESSPVPTPVRQWRPAAQRNLRNQWSRLFAATNRWTSAAAGGRSAATALVNAHLSRRYLPAMDLGVLKDMPGIRVKASRKLSRQQELSHIGLLSSYKEMVDIICDMIKTCASMRCFLKGFENNSLIQFSNYSDDKNDLGDGGGIPIFSSWSIASFEKVAQELVKMFVLELYFKRLLVVELLGINSRDSSREEAEELNWSRELYPGEFDDLTGSSLLSDGHQQYPNAIKDWEPDITIYKQHSQTPEREVLQVYLTAWISHVNIDVNRVEDIFEMVEELMQVKLS